MSKPETWVERHAVDGFTSMQYMAMSTNDPIVILRASSDLMRAWEDMQVQAVQQARAEGQSWAEIAEALNRSRQSVWRQYAHQVGENGDNEVPLVITLAAMTMDIDSRFSFMIAVVGYLMLLFKYGLRSELVFGLPVTPGSWRVWQRPDVLIVNPAFEGVGV